MGPPDRTGRARPSHWADVTRLVGAVGLRTFADGGHILRRLQGGGVQQRLGGTGFAPGTGIRSGQGKPARTVKHRRPAHTAVGPHLTGISHDKPPAAVKRYGCFAERHALCSRGRYHVRRQAQGRPTGAGWPWGAICAITGPRWRGVKRLNSGTETLPARAGMT
jgi:hypothetical protein